MPGPWGVRHRPRQARPGSTRRPAACRQACGEPTAAPPRRPRPRAASGGRRAPRPGATGARPAPGRMAGRGGMTRTAPTSRCARSAGTRRAGRSPDAHRSHARCQTGASRRAPQSRARRVAALLAHDRCAWPRALLRRLPAHASGLPPSARRRRSRPVLSTPRRQATALLRAVAVCRPEDRSARAGRVRNSQSTARQGRRTGLPLRPCRGAVASRGRPGCARTTPAAPRHATRQRRWRPSPEQTPAPGRRRRRRSLRATRC